MTTTLAPGRESTAGSAYSPSQTVAEAPVGHDLMPSHGTELHPALNAIPYGIIAEFEDVPHLLVAAARARDAGFKRMDAYAPFPVEGLSEALGFRDNWIPTIMLVGGILGCLAGFGLQYYCTVLDYPFNVGGRPLLGWPSFIPITFELTVLTAALVGVIGMILINGLPMPYHPVFGAPNFEAASSHRFFLCIEVTDPQFDAMETRRFMDTLGALRVSEVTEQH